MVGKRDEKREAFAGAILLQLAIKRESVNRFEGRDKWVIIKH